MILMQQSALASQENNLWYQIKHDNDSTPFVTHHQRIANKIDWYQKQLLYTASVSRRAGLYLPYIIDQLKARDLPLALALLPVIESDFRMTQSHRGAAGIWQLMPTTAKYYNVPINEYFDGRYDLILATNAALDYLTDLYLIFDRNWLLAIAAYNCGEGCVKRALRKNRVHSDSNIFWQLNLPKETTEYVPKFLALNAILHQYPNYFAPVETSPSVEVVDIEQPFSILTIAELISLPSSEILKYNSAYIADQSPPNGPFHLLLPNQLAHKLKKTLILTRYGKDKPYTIKKGDSLHYIAKLTNTSVEKLRSFNQLSSDTIYYGKTLFLPRNRENLPSLVREYAISPFLVRTKPTYEHLEINYKVEPNDSLWHIANLFGVSVQEICMWNTLNKNTLIKPGQKIRIVKTKLKEPVTHSPKTFDFNNFARSFSISGSALLNN
jgi:membrane-bound lytic murein transglycosylase D